MNNFAKFRAQHTLQSSKFAWQAEILSYTLQIFKICITFKDVQMVLLPFSEISSGFLSKRKLIRLGLHVSPRTLWADLMSSFENSTPPGGQFVHQTTILFLFHIVWHHLQSLICHLPRLRRPRNGLPKDDLIHLPTMLVFLRPRPLVRPDRPLLWTKKK